MTAQAGLSSVNVINQWLSTLRNAPFAVPALYGQLHTGIPGSTGTKVISAGSASRFPMVFAAAANNAINLHGNPPLWMNGGYNGETVSHLSIWSQEAAGAFNANGIFYLSAPFTAPVAWNASDTLALDSMSVSLGPAATASAEGLSSDLIAAWLNTFTGVGGNRCAIKQVYAELHTSHPGAAGASALSAVTDRSLVTFAAAANNSIALTGTPPAWSNGIVKPSGLAVTGSSTGGTLAAGTYFWVVTAITADGETKASNEVTATLTGTTSSAALTWTLPAGATGAKVYRGTAAGAEGTLVATLGAVSTYTDAGAVGTSATPPATDSTGTTETVTHMAFFDTESGANIAAPSGVSVAGASTGGSFTAGTYYWVITATNFAGETIASSEVNATLTGQTSSAVLSWTLPDGATGVRIYRGTATGAENKLVAKLGAVTTYTDTGDPGVTGTAPVSSTAKSFLFSVPLPAGIAWTGGDDITLDTLAITLSPAATSS